MPSPSSPATLPAAPPSPPWHGALLVILLFGAAAIVLTYTLLDLPAQQRLGAWNYVAAAALVPAAALVIRTWRPDQTR